MARTPLFDRVLHLMGLARTCNDLGISTAEGIEREVAAQEARRTRREFLGDAATAAAAGGLLLAGGRKAYGQPKSAYTDVGIVGAGLAGLSCADTLAKKGVIATLYDARDRVGGRCWSERTLAGFEGQVFEHGGELIDTGHKTMQGYAQRFGLALEKQWATFGGTETYYFGGKFYTEAQVIDAYRVFFNTMQNDLRIGTNGATADVHNDADVALDRTNLADYFAGRRPFGGGAMPSPAIDLYTQAYIAEYGLECEQQSALNFLYFAKASRRSKLILFGNFSDERYHIVTGNDGVALGLKHDLAAAGCGFNMGYRLLRVAKRSDGRIELTFDTGGGKSVTTSHQAVVITIPFSVLRGIDLQVSLGLPPWKLAAIQQLGYGNNAKTMLRFRGRPWGALGSVGVSYSDLANHQNTWETNPSRSTAQKAILTDYAGGDRGATLSVSKLQTNVGKFLTDLDKVWPGSKSAALKYANGDYVAYLQHWPSDPLNLGSYTCYTPGQFTTIAGNEGKPVGNLFFGGEHANSFYDWQGFMEGACLSGIDTANLVLG